MANELAWTPAWRLREMFAKRELSPLTSEAFLTRLCANKKEVSVFGTAGMG